MRYESFRFAIFVSKIKKVNKWKISTSRKNQNYDVDISDLTYQGLGVAKIDDFPIFIENALPTENVTMKVIKVKKNFAFGRVVKINKKSKDRVELVDKAYTQTGIAPLQHLKYDAQLKFKQHQIEVDFSKMKLDVKVDPTIGMDDPTHYRNKAQIPVRMINGKLQTGFYRKHSHDLYQLRTSIFKILRLMKQLSLFVISFVNSEFNHMMKNLTRVLFETSWCVVAIILTRWWLF